MIKCYDVGYSCFTYDDWFLDTQKWKIFERIIHNPLNYFRLRHVLRDARVKNVIKFNQFKNLDIEYVNSSIVMWPVWENGFGDVWGTTILPMMSTFTTSRHMISKWAFSGMKNRLNADVLKHKLKKVCAFERVPSNWESCNFCSKFTKVCISTDLNSIVQNSRNTMKNIMISYNNFTIKEKGASNEIALIARPSIPRAIDWHSFIHTCKNCKIVYTNTTLVNVARELKDVCAVVYVWGGQFIHTLLAPIEAQRIEVQNEVFFRKATDWAFQNFKWNDCLNDKYKSSCHRYLTKSSCTSLNCAWKSNISLSDDFFKFVNEKIIC